MWVTFDNNSICKLDSNGEILTSTLLGNGSQHPVFDGTNFWVPNFFGNSVMVVRAKGALSGTVVATLTGNGLSLPFRAAFDAERILVTNQGGFSVSLWNASDLTPVGTFPIGGRPFEACSDGLNFWITLNDTGKLARF